MNGSKIVAIAALGKDTRFICEDDRLLWRITEDLKRVKDITMGHPLIMGRKTFQSIGKPLPGRENIVLTKNTSYQAEGIKVAHSVDEALKIAKEGPGGDKIFIFGGAEIYNLFIDHTDTLLLTLVDSDKQGTAKFPPYKEKFHVVKQEKGGNYYDKDTQITSPYEWLTLER